MKFEIFYLLAKIRGICLKENCKADLFMAQKDKNLLKDIYITLKWIPYRIDIHGTEFIT